MQEKQCSVIVPAYNAEKTVMRCLDEMLSCDTADFEYEIIVVNDGSTDRTAEILERYKGDPRVRVIHRENGGVSAARNTGLDAARGKYIAFSDADDALFLPALRQCVRLAEQHRLELVVADYNEVHGDTGEETRRFPTIEYGRPLGHEAVRQMLHDLALGKNDGLANVWNKVFLRKILLENRVRFDTRRTHGEDWDFCIRYFLRTERLLHTDAILYLYRMDGTQSWNKYKKHLGRGLIMGHETIGALNTELHLLSDAEHLRFKARFLGQIVSFLRLDGLSDGERRAFLREKTVRDCLAEMLRLPREALYPLGYSRRDRLWMLLLQFGMYKTAKRFMK